MEARVNEALGEFEDLRIAVCVRNMDSREFMIFEEVGLRFATEDYIWEQNDRGNLKGLDKLTIEHRFTWRISWFAIYGEAKSARFCN